MIDNQTTTNHAAESHLPVLQIPLDFGRRHQTFSYESAHVQIDPSLIPELSQKLGADSLYPVLLTAYAALLYRLSGEREIAVGAVCPERTATLRLELHGKMAFRELNDQVSAQLQHEQDPSAAEYPETLFMLNSVQLLKGRKS